MGKTLHIKIDKTIEDLIPGYLDNRKKDIGLLKNALEQEDFETIKKLGHKLKGSGGGYGFDALSRMGQTLEISAKGQQNQKIKETINDLIEYLENISITYE